MAAELEQDLGVKPELVEGSRGIFDVSVDGQLVYSKYDTHRFPDDGEVSRLLREG